MLFMPPLHLSSNMLKYQQYLKKKYKILALSSPDEILKCRSSRYVNLQLIKYNEETMTTEEELLCGQLDDILKIDSKPDKKITCYR